MVGFSLPRRTRPSGLSSTVMAAAGLLLLARASSAASYPPASTNCAAAPANATSWEIRNFTVDTDSNLYYGPGTLGRASFSIKNSANGYEFSCTQGSGLSVDLPNLAVKNGSVWYSCAAYCYPLSVSPPLDTQFHFDLDNKTLSVRQKWSCASGSAPYVASPGPRGVGYICSGIRGGVGGA